ncbi:cytochrome b561 and DOMON domain-containing protein [Salix suchowensis]|nr:cytochrome b561 and DOMON domain-containing protein [Salix suchowensis]
MDKSLTTLLFSCTLLIFLCVPPSLAQTCGNYTFSGNRSFSTCNDLPQLSCSLHWNYHPSNMTADIAFRKSGASTSNWISWSLNPRRARMAGSQALVAYRQSDGSMYAYTTQLDGNPNMQPGGLSFDVPRITANILRSTNQVWQEGPMKGGNPGTHSFSGQNGRSVGTVNFVNGSVLSTSGTSSKTQKRNVHGVLNAVSWGILMPVGIIIARYLKVFKSAGPAWFYLHVICQSSGYAVGVAGWATGIKLGSDSPGITYGTHRNLGIIIFFLGTLQVLALLLRPKPEHKYRRYWNIYHHTVGYTTVVLSIGNIFEGFDILDSGNTWKTAYIGVLVFLGVVAAVMEALTWSIVIKRKKTASSAKHANGEHMHGSREQQTA